MAEQVVDYYRRERVLEIAVEQPGCLAAEIQLPVVEGEPLLVTALWETPEAYQGWLDNPIRRTFAGGLDGVVDEELADTGGSLYEVVHAVGESAVGAAGHVRRDEAANEGSGRS